MISMLEDFLKANEIKAEILEFEEKVETSVVAAKKASVPLEAIVKSVLFVSNGLGVLVIVLGNQKVSVEKLRAIMGDEKIQLASEPEVEEITGYETGGVPPISIFGVKILMDSGVLKQKIVWAGGGSNNKLLKISPKELKRALEETSEDFAILDMAE